MLAFKRCDYGYKDALAPFDAKALQGSKQQGTLTPSGCVHNLMSKGGALSNEPKQL